MITISAIALNFTSIHRDFLLALVPVLVLRRYLPFNIIIIVIMTIFLVNLALFTLVFFGFPNQFPFANGISIVIYFSILS